MKISAPVGLRIEPEICVALTGPGRLGRSLRCSRVRGERGPSKSPIGALPRWYGTSSLARMNRCRRLSSERGRSRCWWWSLEGAVGKEDYGLAQQMDAWGKWLAEAIRVLADPKLPRGWEAVQADGYATIRQVLEERFRRLGVQ